MGRPACCVVLLFLLAVGLINGTSVQAVAAGHAPADRPTAVSGLTVESHHRAWGKPHDFDAVIGETVELLTFVLSCEGADSTAVTIGDDSPHFAPEQASLTLTCGSGYDVRYRFTPTMPGLTATTVTFSSSIGSATAVLVGNGVVAQEATYWIDDLSAENSASRLVFDGQRNHLYISDTGLDRILVYDLGSRSVIRTIAVGRDPIGLALSSSRQELLVANTGEYAISVVDLNSWTETARIPTPPLGPLPGYFPFDITVAGDRLALLSSFPSGSASGGPIHQLDLETQQVSPRPDLGSGAYALLRTSRDLSTTAIRLEVPPASIGLALYDRASDSASIRGGEIGYTLAVNRDGSRVVTTCPLCSELVPNLSVFNRALNDPAKVSLLGCQTIGAAFNPATQNLVYAVDGRVAAIDEADINALRQVRRLNMTLPDGYYQAAHRIVVSENGAWAYMLLSQTWNAPPSRLLAVYVGDYDNLPPVSAVTTLSPEQAHTCWGVSWSGSDNRAGVHRFEVQFRAGANGSWQDWLVTQSRSALFRNAVPGETYGFRVRAIDQFGNAEAYSNAHVAATRAGSQPCEANLLPLIVR